MTATSAFFRLVGTSAPLNSFVLHGFRRMKAIKFCNSSSVRFKSVAVLHSEVTVGVNGESSQSNIHPWPEWINFVDKLKDKGYIIDTPSATESGGSNLASVVDRTEMRFIKEACLSFARDRYDIFKSLSTEDMRILVGNGCPKVLRKTVNSAKRLRAYLELEEGDVCGSCSLRGSCDRAYVILNELESTVRTVDIVRILLVCALDPLVLSVENIAPDKAVTQASARRLLSELIQLSETPFSPDMLNPAPVTSLQKKSSMKSLDKRNSQTVDVETGHWVCTKCNLTNSSRNSQCKKCGESTPSLKARGVDVEMKKGDWICPECSYMNFGRNACCLKCKAEGPKVESGNILEMKLGDWNCPGCTFMNFASNKKCFRCQEPRPPRNLRPGEWECSSCDFLNFSRNKVCKRCNLERPIQEYSANYDEQTWKKLF